MRWFNYIITCRSYRAFQPALTLTKVESVGSFPHSLPALYRGWLIICSSHMLTHDLLLSFSGPVSWDISCFHQPLSFVQQQLACHLAATLLWMCPPFACSCCTWARQSVQILTSFITQFYICSKRCSVNSCTYSVSFLCLGYFSSGSDRWALLANAAAQDALRPKADLYDYQTVPTVSDLCILFVFHCVLNV